MAKPGDTLVNGEPEPVVAVPNNLFHWNNLCAEDPEASKITGKTYKGTSPRPMHMLKKMTEAFGPVGVGWGYDIAKTWSEDIPHLTEGTTDCVIVYVQLRLFIKNGVTWEQIGSCKKVYTTQSGRNFVDDDAYKKATTDALTKALSHIGVCANTYGLQKDVEHEERAEPEPNVAQQLHAMFVNRCEAIDIRAADFPKALDKILRELSVEKTIASMTSSFPEISAAILTWEPPKAGDFDEPVTKEPEEEAREAVDKGDETDRARKYMHGAISERFDVDGDTAHNYLKSALPKQFEDDLSRVNTMKLASALVQRTINLIETGKPVRD